MISALFLGGAERAGCDASHSHEVADAWVLDDSLVAAYPGQGELTQREQARCEAAFEAYVGRASEGLVARADGRGAAARPNGTTGSRVAVCLVGNRDGSFLSGHAAGSGR